MFLVVIRSSTADLPMIATESIPAAVSCSTTVVKASHWLLWVLVRINHVVMLLIRWIPELCGGVAILPGILIGHHHPRHHILDHLYRTAHTRKDTAAIGKGADLLERHAEGI